MLVVAFVLDAVGYLEKDKRESLDDTAKMFGPGPGRGPSSAS